MQVLQILVSEEAGLLGNKHKVDVTVAVVVWSFYLFDARLCCIVIDSCCPIAFVYPCWDRRVRCITAGINSLLRI